MGLDLSHGDFCLSYFGFNSFRQGVASLTGGSFPPHKDNYIYWSEGFPEEHPGITEFLKHSDCDGEIKPDMCKIIADELTELKCTDPELKDNLERFIKSCRLAHEANEPLEFI